MKPTGNYQAELLHLIGVSDRALKTILTAGDSKQKHPAFSYRSEPELEHVLKGIGHLVQHLKIQNGWQEPNGESHLHNALARVVMAIANLEEKQGEDK